jgi:hypothetical protein
VHALMGALVVTAMLQPVYEAPFAVRLSEGARAIAEKQWVQEQQQQQQSFTKAQEQLRGGPETMLSRTSQSALNQQAARGQVTLPGMLDSQGDRR